jgi:4-hydroxy-tetrahydrodipicolinate reductase
VTNIAVAGAGRMGQAIVRLSSNAADITVKAVWAREPSKIDLQQQPDILVSDDLDEVLALADVLIDFSLPDATLEVLETAVRQNKALVSGVSGLDEAQMAAIDEASKGIPVLHDRNMSQGIAVLDAAIRYVAKSIGPQFTVEINETHHIHKKDAPSGTALLLGESIQSARGAGKPVDIHYESERRGEVPGDHSVIIAKNKERLEFSHSVTTRDVFAEGALVAARWLAGRKPGRYSMQDVLFAD